MNGVRNHGRLLAALGAFVALAGLVLATPASAAFPGHNGKIYFDRYRHKRSQIYRINPDGSHRQRLTFGRGRSFAPAPSPNGKTTS